jgi:ABC-type sulfate transport system permease component
MIAVAVKIVVALLLVSLGVVLVILRIREYRRHPGRALVEDFVDSFLFSPDLLFGVALTVFGCGWFIYLVTHMG